ncbi:hypothetical protein GCM10027348_19600 [Hymenobacter tenuis]
MLTQKSYDDLECHLAGALSAVAGRFTCDGVLGPEWQSDYLPEHVAHSKQIIMRAWIDEGYSKGNQSRQTLYTLVLHLGASSLQVYLQERELTGILVRGLNPEWVRIDPSSKLVEVRFP